MELLFHPSLMLRCQNFNFVNKMLNYYQYIMGCGGIMKDERDVGLFRCAKGVLFY